MTLFCELKFSVFYRKKNCKDEDYPDEMDDDIEDNWEIMSLASNCSFFLSTESLKTDSI